MVKLSKNTNIETFRERLGVGKGKELRESSRREDFLRTFVRYMAMDPNIQLQLSNQPPHISYDGEYPSIHIPREKLDQPETNFPRKVFDIMVQETISLHEVGHYLYSDWDSFDKLRKSLDEKWHSAFHSVWNGIEDGAMEKQLREEFNCSDEFAVLHANLVREDRFGQIGTHKDGKKYHIFTMLDAVLLSIMELGYHRTGKLDELLDENNGQVILAGGDVDYEAFVNFFPEIQKVIRDTHSEPRAVARNERVFGFFEELIKILDNADYSGIRNNARESVRVADGILDDANEGMGEARGDMDRLPTPEEIESAIGSPDEGADGIPGQGGSNPGDGDEVPENASPTDRDGDIAKDLAEEYSEEIQAEIDSVQDGQATAEEAEKFVNILGDEGGPGSGNTTLEIPEGETGDMKTWREANDVARQIVPILRNKLKQATENRPVRNQYMGAMNMDNPTMLKLARHDPRIFSKKRRDDEKDYSCIVIQDRSGSMSGQQHETEVAVSSLTIALDELGIDVSIIDVYSGDIRLTKPFGTSPSGSKDALTSGRTSGGTPLSDALFFAKERINLGAGTNPFVIVVTDGKAHNSEKYQEELMDCWFPVLGVYIRKDIGNRGSDKISKIRKDMDGFHYYTVVTKEDNIKWCMSDLASQMIF